MSASSYEVRPQEVVQETDHDKLPKQGFFTRITDRVRGLFNADYLGDTLLHKACKQGSLATVQTLIEGSANPNTKNNVGFSPLLYACIPIAIGVNRPYKYKYKPDIVKYLLDNGAEVDKDTFVSLATLTFAENSRLDNELPVFDLGLNTDATEILNMLLVKCSEKDSLLQYIKDKAKRTADAPVIQYGQEYFEKERLDELSNKLEKMEKMKESNGGKRKTRKTNKKRKSVQKQKRRVRKTARR